jgi:hypothetical protein
MIHAIEPAIAAEAAAHTLAAAELNPFADADVLDLGGAFACYGGIFSPANGVHGLGMNGAVEARDLAEIERFFQQKEARPAFWICDATDPSLLELLGSYSATKHELIYGAALEKSEPLKNASGTNAPEPELWPLAFTRARDPQKKEPDLLALVKLHQKETRRYLNGEQDASYTYFHNSVAWVPHVSSNELLALQWNDAREFRAKYFASYKPQFPKLYERTLYERL